MKFLTAVFSVSALWALPATAELREMSQSDLRAAVSAERTLSSRSVMAGVENYTGGEVLEIRAFENAGAVTFRVLFRQDTGALAAIMIDGQDGRAVLPQSDVGKSISNLIVQQVAAGNNANATFSKTSADANSNSGGNGNGNSGGNGNGNSGGNGNGNSGGNGNGNSGGNGNGRGANK